MIRIVRWHPDIFGTGWSAVRTCAKASCGEKAKFATMEVTIGPETGRRYLTPRRAYCRSHAIAYCVEHWDNLDGGIRQLPYELSRLFRPVMTTLPKLGSLTLAG